MLVLGLDCSVNACSVALLDEGSVVASRFLAETAASGHAFGMRRQAEQLMLLTQQLLRYSKTDAQCLDKVGVTIGPGSFSGVRAGMSAAKAFAFVASCPLFGVTTADSLMHRYRQSHQQHARHAVRVVLPSVRERFFIRDYHNGIASGAWAETVYAKAFAAESAELFLAPPSLAQLVPASLSAWFVYPDALSVAEQALAQKDVEHDMSLQPFYGRSHYAS